MSAMFQFRRGYQRWENLAKEARQLLQNTDLDQTLLRSGILNFHLAKLWHYRTTAEPWLTKKEYPFWLTRGSLFWKFTGKLM